MLGCMMEETFTAYGRRKHSSPRRDGLSTRNMVLEAAGRVFAERGYAKSTSREICEKAGVNSAAINYYFGGKEGLYEEVLVEAHRQLVSLEELHAVMESGGAPEDKLRAFLELAVRAALRAPELWGLPVLLREVASPCSSLPEPLVASVLPKLQIVRSLVCEVTGLTPGTEEERHATALVLMPCLSLVLFPEKIQSLLLPGFMEHPQAMIEAMMRYVMGGLNALKAEEAKRKGEVS